MSRQRALGNVKTILKRAVGIAEQHAAGSSSGTANGSSQLAGSSRSCVSNQNAALQTHLQPHQIYHQLLLQPAQQPAMQQHISKVLQPFRNQLAPALLPQQSCTGIHMLPRLRLSQPLRPQALGGRRHMLPYSGSRSVTTSSSSSSINSRLSTRAMLSHLAGGPAAAAAAAAAAARRRAAAAFTCHRLLTTAAAAARSNVSTAAAAGWMDTWALWVGENTGFLLASLLNALNLVGNKLPVALGLLLVDMAHNSPLLGGSRADALQLSVLPDKLPAGGYYAAGGAAATAAALACADSSSSSSSNSSWWGSAKDGLSTAWGEASAAASAGARLLWLGAIWLPALVSAPLLLGWESGRAWWLTLMTLSLEMSGPAFIKWGQWAATRHDLFAADVCEALEKLHTQAPAHSFRYTCMALRHSFDLPPSELFDWIEESPIACGSIGQVHRAVLSDKGAALTGCAAGDTVAVKVRHPGVGEAIERDFQTMVWVAHMATKLMPHLASLRLDDTLKQFAAPLHEQVDLSREAANLQRFNTNFRRARGVSFPLPLYPLVSPDVLVESFEAGTHISAYITDDKGSKPYRVRLAELGSGTMLQMMLVDNLIHSDLHPGNILVRLDQPHGLLGLAYKTLNRLADPEGTPMKTLAAALDAISKSSSNSSSSDSSDMEVVTASSLAVTEQQQQQQPSSNSRSAAAGSSRSIVSKGRAWMSGLCAAYASGGPAAVVSQVHASLSGVAAGWLQPHIVLLDVGMATELSGEDQANMVGLFRSFAALDGRDVARWTLRFSGPDQSCSDPQAFIDDMEATFDTLKKTIAAQQAAQARWEQQQHQQQHKQQRKWWREPQDISSSANGAGLLDMPEQFDSGAEALATVLELVRLHGVSLPGHIAGCVVTTLILEGWSNKLAPNHSVLRQVQSMFSPALLPWHDRMDAVVDTVMDRQDTALAMT